MLEYVKTILQKVSFSKYLFERELKKGLRYLLPSEIEEFRDWCYAMFSQVYLSVLNRHFKPAY
ncbi:hypothetical protein DFQ04_2114 [Algoriphagus boseongensis]|uniref:Uncharacterized protein n=1 Tax=Algoriphagus boseongensis TaxID=1442587 RepID=A0A4V3D289_9BACT|nr:hypothetical protein DFQ04_2114 [Algoriphagus boseongensis]